MRSLTFLSLFVSLNLSGVAHAQQSKPADNIARSESLPPATSSNDPTPPAPSPLVGQSPSLVRQAGIGGHVSYARAGVMELGGAIDFADSSLNTTFAFTPSFGWFLTDNFEMSAIVRGAFAHADDENIFHITGLIEPSVHIPLVDTAFVFAGVGVGVAYLQENQNAGFALAPRVGFNFLVGRSGIISPSATLNYTTSKTVAASTDEPTPRGATLLAVSTQWAANIGYSVMW